MIAAIVEELAVAIEDVVLVVVEAAAVIVVLDILTVAVRGPEANRIYNSSIY